MSPVQTGPWAHPASCKMGTGSIPRVKCSRGVLLTTHPLLVPLPSWKSTSAVRKVSSHFEYLEDRSLGLDVTWQPVRGDLTVHREQSLSRGASQSAVRRRWQSLCTVWPSHSQWPREQISFITTIRLPVLQLSCRLSLALPRSVSTPTAQIWLPATSGFSQS